MEPLLLKMQQVRQQSRTIIEILRRLQNLPQALALPAPAAIEQFIPPKIPLPPLPIDLEIPLTPPLIPRPQ